MLLRHVKTILSRAAVEALSPLEQRQFLSAAVGCLGSRVTTAEQALQWCDHEQLGWHVLELAAPDGTTYELWMLGSDDGVVFERGSPEHMGIGVSQGGVSDMKDDRDALCASIQAALDEFEFPPHEDWQRG